MKEPLISPQLSLSKVGRSLEKKITVHHDGKILESTKLRMAASLIDSSLRGKAFDLQQIKQADFFSDQRHSLLAQLQRSSIFSTLLLSLVVTHHAISFKERAYHNQPSSDYDENEALVCQWIEFCILIAYTLDTFLVQQRFRSARWWEVSMCLLVVLLLLDWILLATGVSSFRFARPLRPLMFSVYLPSAFKVVSALVHMIPNIFSNLMLWFVLVLFFASWGHYSFNTHDINYNYNLTKTSGNCDEDFSKFGRSMMAVFVWQTTENYPFVWYPLVAEKPFSATAYLVFLNLAMYMFEAVLFSNIFNAYVEQHRSRDIFIREEQQRLLFVCYVLLQDNDIDAVAPVPFKRWLGMLQLLKPYLTIDEAVDLASKMRTPGPPSKESGAQTTTQSPITFLEFMRTTEILQKENFVSSSRWRRIVEQYCAIMWKWLCEYSNPVSIAIRIWKRWCDSNKALLHYAFVSCAILQVIVIVTRPEGMREPTWEADCPHIAVGAWEFFSLFFLCTHAAHLAQQLVCKGITAFHDKQLRNNVSAVILVVGTCAEVTRFITCAADVSEDVDYTDTYTFEFVGFGRSVRILWVLLAPDIFADLWNVLVRGSTMAVNMLTIYTILTYTYAVVGLELFGGFVATPAMDSDQYMTEQHSGFSSLWDTVLIFFQISIGNNWQDMVHPNMDATHQEWAALFFVSYFVIFTMILLNVCIGVASELSEDASNASPSAGNEAEGEDGEETPDPFADLLSILGQGRVGYIGTLLPQSVPLDDGTVAVAAATSPPAVTKGPSDTAKATGGSNATDAVAEGGGASVYTPPFVPTPNPATKVATMGKSSGNARPRVQSEMVPLDASRKGDFSSIANDASKISSTLRRSKSAGANSTAASSKDNGKDGERLLLPRIPLRLMSSNPYIPPPPSSFGEVLASNPSFTLAEMINRPDLNDVLTRSVVRAATLQRHSSCVHLRARRTNARPKSKSLNGM